MSGARKTIKRLDWRRCPTGWVRKGRLHDLAPKHGSIADQVMALACLTKIIHEADQQTGVARVTYDAFERTIGHSRSKVARGLAVLDEHGLIERGEARSTYALDGFDPERGWGKFPWRGFHPGGSEVIRAFEAMRLRQRAELDAMKLLFLLVAARDNKTNLAHVTYDAITEQTGIARQHIPAAVGLLVTHQLVYPRSAPSEQSEYGVSTSYRLRGIDARRHEGTTGRATLGQTPALETTGTDWIDDLVI